MNCQAIQNQILNLDDPRELTPALREHVLTCAACQAWARQAALLESLLERLPVPPAPADKKGVLIGQLMHGGPIVQPLATPARPELGAALQFLRRNASYVGGLAAAVLVAFGAYLLWPSKPQEVVKAQPPQKHPLLEKIVAGNTAIARADSSKRKLELLGGMADDITTDLHGMARIASGAELRQMAGWYDKVVKDGMVPQAGKLPNDMPGEDKAKLLDSVADKLAADAREARKMSGEVPPDAKPALQRVAEAASQGEEKFRSAATAVRRGGN